MNINRVKDEMQFLSNCVTNDLEYLAYILLRKNKINIVEEEEDCILKNKENGYLKENLLEDWFNKL